MRNEVEHSSRVVTEEKIAQIEGQVQVGLHEGGLVEHQVAVVVGSISVGSQQLCVLFATESTRTELGIQAHYLTHLIAETELAIKILENIPVVEDEFSILIEWHKTVVGQVSVVDGKTALSKDVEVPFDRLRLILLRIEAQRKDCHDDNHQQFAKRQMLLHNVI